MDNGLRPVERSIGRLEVVVRMEECTRKMKDFEKLNITYDYENQS
jgi:hypothetical protein